MGIIVGNAGIIASDYSSHTSNSAVDNIIVERPVRSPVQAAEQVVDCFMAESGNQFRFLCRYKETRFAIGEIIDGRSDDSFGGFQRIGVIELHVCCALNFRSFVGSN